MHMHLRAVSLTVTVVVTVTVTVTVTECNLVWLPTSFHLLIAPNPPPRSPPSSLSYMLVTATPQIRPFYPMHITIYCTYS